jgi:tetratricopeptide (TPR) repeat protein
MAPDNLIVKLCVAGTQAEFKGKMDEACALYQQAWEAATDDYEACIAAHYVARCQASPENVLRWNREALERAGAVNNDSIREFYPSLYLNMGRSYELLGQQSEAEKYYLLAAELGVTHEMSEEHERHF